MSAALMIGCAAGVALKDLVVPAHAQPGGPSYEYKVIKSTWVPDADYYENAANQFGKEGWRFAFAIQRGDYTLLTFERPKPRSLPQSSSD
jgi:hypothetical protein